ncbi:MAG: outer membrane protein assembly factor BamD [Flavobacteriales bacterium]|nr:outer membrane protein assembly factor BamD [Flavobacteriales bacterium]
MKFKGLVLISLLILLLGSCSEHQKVMKSTDLKLKYDKAIEYFESEAYLKALPLFEELIIIYRGTPRAEKLSYYQAYCDYHLGDLLLASYRFRTFAKTFPISQWAEECLFMSAYCNYLNSPKSSLDQSATYSAINDMQLFTRVNPDSELVDSCNYLIDELKAKLEQKAFDNAYQYYHMRRHKAAITSFQNLLSDFPLTKHEEEIRFLILESNYSLATNSVYSKKGNRLMDVEKAYNLLKKSYPESEHLKQAEDVIEKANSDRLNLPEELYDLGYFEDAVKWSKYLLDNVELDESQKIESSWMRLNAMFQAAITGVVGKKRTRLKSTTMIYLEVKETLIGSKHEEKSIEINSKAQSQLENLHVSIPMYYYNSGSYSKAINAFETTLKKYPEFDKKDQFTYYALHSYYLRMEASNKYETKKERLLTALGYFSANNFGAYQENAQADYDKCLATYDEVVSKELKSLYKAVKEEYTTFATDFEYAVAFYQSEKDELKTDSGKEKAAKTYESIMRYSAKYQLTKTK